MNDSTKRCKECNGTGYVIERNVYDEEYEKKVPCSVCRVMFFAGEKNFPNDKIKWN